jgi:hypothetical protein
LLAPEFVAAEIQEWIDAYPALSKEQKELFIELSKRIIASYQYYKQEVSKDNNPEI